LFPPKKCFKQKGKNGKAEKIMIAHCYEYLEASGYLICSFKK